MRQGEKRYSRKGEGIERREGGGNVRRHTEKKKRIERRTRDR